MLKFKLCYSCDLPAYPDIEVVDGSPPFISITVPKEKIPANSSHFK